MEHRGKGEPYRLLIVDDEEIMRQGLSRIVPFASLGFTVVGLLPNGLEALQKCEELRPDIVLTDIRMPLMDGLTMCREMHKILPLCRFVILSGYNDFSYAQEAIDMKAMKYLLKPVTSAELAAAFREIREAMDQEFELHRDAARLSEAFQRNLPQMREQLLGYLLTERYAGSEEVAQYARDCGIPLEAGQYVLALASTGAQKSDSVGIGNPALRDAAVRNIATEVFAENANVYLFGYERNLALLFLYDQTEPANMDDVVGRMERLRKTVFYYLNLPLAVGISAPCVHIDRLAECRDQALAALRQSAFNDAEALCLFTDARAGGVEWRMADSRLLEQLRSALKLEDAAAARQAVGKLLDLLGGMEVHSAAARVFRMEVLLTFLRTLQECGVEIDAMAEQYLSQAWQRETAYPSLTALRAELEALCGETVRLIAQRHVSKQQQIVRRATELMKRHFCEENMTIERAAQEVSLSQSHFSLLFKRETGKTFHQVLNEMRMERARELLMTTALKNAQIAEQVGIPDPSYFSYAFKRYFGYSPSSLRGANAGK